MIGARVIISVAYLARHSQTSSLAKTFVAAWRHAKLRMYFLKLEAERCRVLVWLCSRRTIANGG